MEMFLGDLLQRQEFINSCVVDEDVEVSVCLLCLGKQAFNVGFLGHITLHGNCLASLRGNFTHDFVGAGFARRVINDDRCAFRAEMFRNRSADTFGCAGNYCYFSRQFLSIVAHMNSLSNSVCSLSIWSSILLLS